MEHLNDDTVNIQNMSREVTESYSAGAALLEELSAHFVIRPHQLERLPRDIRRSIGNEPRPELVLGHLVQHEILSEYQAERIKTAGVRDLILGNYCIVDYLGRSAMGTVYQCRHLHLARAAAVKVLSAPSDALEILGERFASETLVLSELSHPNIVFIFDAGQQPTEDLHTPVLHYFAMEYVPGLDLQQRVEKHGPIKVELACMVAYQLASALHEAHRHLLVHRDVKPSNVRVTPENEAKLLDFGIAKFLGKRLTQSGSLMGSLDYMAPEQMTDAGSVDIRADIYGLGGTLFWCLTGEPPFGTTRRLVDAKKSRARVPCARHLLPDLPVELDAVLRRMLAPNPNDRYPSPESVMRALDPYRTRFASSHHMETTGRATHSSSPGLAKKHRLLIVDDEPHNRAICRTVLEGERCECDEAADGLEALAKVREKDYDLVMLDVDMPRMTGTETLERLRGNPPSENLKIIMLSGRVTSEALAEMMAVGADDFIAKPFTLTELTNRVKAALRLKDAQDRASQFSQHLLRVNHSLEENLLDRQSDLVDARNALVLGLAELVAQRDNETGAHLLRLQRYSRVLSEEASQWPAFGSEISGEFIDMVEGCAPLHDIGKVAVPDEILLKPGRLTAEERVVMESHTSIGSDVLDKVAAQHGFAVAFLQMASDIARHHHERWDGVGYPSKLSGNAIPLAARIVSIADVYDALRSRRPYKTAFPHITTVNFILNSSRGQFDPTLLRVFENCAERFETIYDQFADR